MPLTLTVAPPPPVVHSAPRHAGQQRLILSKHDFIMRWRGAPSNSRGRNSPGRGLQNWANTLWADSIHQRAALYYVQPGWEGRYPTNWESSGNRSGIRALRGRGNLKVGPRYLEVLGEISNWSDGEPAAPPPGLQPPTPEVARGIASRWIWATQARAGPRSSCCR
jgi:hypothetical protein